MEEYLIDDIKEYERLYKITKDKHIKDFYRFKIQQILEKISNLFKAFEGRKIKGEDQNGENKGEINEILCFEQERTHLIKS